MKTSTRRSLGAVVLVISLLVALVLYVSGTPLLTLQESQTSSFPGGSVTASCFEMHFEMHCGAALVHRAPPQPVYRLRLEFGHFLLDSRPWMT
jgi:hypothetical protein